MDRLDSGPSGMVSCEDSGVGALQPQPDSDAISVLVFDFDGLLMDTESTSLASWRYEWSQWGLPSTRAVSSLTMALISARSVTRSSARLSGRRMTVASATRAARRTGTACIKNSTWHRESAVDDTAHEVAAARAAGLRCIAIPNPFANRCRFSEAGLILESAAEMSLSRVLASLG